MFVEADDRRLQYSGRIDTDNPKAPIFIYPCTYVKICFTGSDIKAKISNRSSYWENYLGVIVDGAQRKLHISKSGEPEELILAEGLNEGRHEVMLFKRQDSCHAVTFYGFEVADDAQVTAPEPLPQRKIEVYGDSVSAGEVSEAVGYVGQPDPIGHYGQHSNSWYSYAWLTARKLNAQIHDIAQGGIALLNNTGWFSAPDLIGMESCYDKIGYYKEVSEIKKWDFRKYTPHVVVVAIGQNDSNPEDYMAKAYDGEKAVHWRKRYFDFIKGLREIYPKAHIILATTILGHDASWDKAIDEVCVRLDDEKIHHFMYSQNGVGTKGHIRISEAQKMSDELVSYIEDLGEDIWTDQVEDKNEL